MRKMGTFDFIVMILIIVGALAWGFIGFFRYDLLAAILGGPLSAASRIVYALVGLAGIWAISFLFRTRQHHEDTRLRGNH